MAISMMNAVELIQHEEVNNFSFFFFVSKILTKFYYLGVDERRSESRRRFNSEDRQRGELRRSISTALHDFC